MPKLVGISRIRNEAAIIADTLDHFAQWCDGGIICYDDCSTDDTVAICSKHPAVTIPPRCDGNSCKLHKTKCNTCGAEHGVIEQFEPWSPDRTREEWRHRQILLEAARCREPQWILYFDADERLEWDGTLPEDETDALYFRLFDAYLTRLDQAPFAGDRKLWGPEYRDIVFAYRNTPGMRYCRPDQRIVLGYKLPALAGFCKHFGKAISIEEWEATCDYYIRFFPPHYKVKWKARKGKAVHTESDFGRPLYTWEEAKAHAVCIGGLPW